ncbi:ABC transporter permease [Kyrpidia spormannii]|uniref:Spermidine/putrescine transport system permease protein n=2 Tax=Kyrpidia spormannii TaxID=2055160 RepID=A0ACA8Z6J4_9BACL|nr:ABC transporter permease [Kyrpidia spormannii]CAB3390717.1 putative spermidine/putrescine transport system permease protein [Kyrpidia spormannii]CAB3391630.1 putative spermidine/putrescine transport system permease protein [Kyrpidia spormannii]HHY68197.1 ABC transporter permease [Alicyclobacillus sp.]
MTIGKVLRGVYLGLLYLFILAPIIVVVASSFTRTNYIVFPPKGFTVRWYGELAQNHPEFLASLGVSIAVGLGTALGATALGTLAALALERYPVPGRRALQELFGSPLVIPSVVLGVALLQWYSAVGIATSILSLIIGHFIIAFPYVVRLVTAKLIDFRESHVERAAANLGATPWQVFWKITLPMIRSGIIAGAVFAFVTSFDDLTVALFVVSTDVQTLPVRLFNYMQYNYDPVVTAISSLMVLLSVVMMVVMERAMGIGQVFGVSGQQAGKRGKQRVYE